MTCHAIPCRGRNTFSHKLAVNLGRRPVRFGEHHHPLTDVLPSDSSQSERSRLAGRCRGDGYPFPLDGADRGLRKTPQRIRTDLDIIASVDHAGLDNAGHDRPDVRDAESVVDVELECRLGIVVTVVREDVEKRADQVQILARHVRDLKDGTYTLAHKLGGCIDALLVVLDENGYFPCPGALENPRDLGDGLLQNLRRADIDFRDNHQDRHVERQGQPEMFP